MRNRDEIVICYGAALTDRIFAKRQLLLRNAPGTQRMTRIAGAFRAVGKKSYIISSAIQPRVKSRWRIEESLASRFNGIPIIAVRQFWVKILGYLIAPIMAIGAARKINRRHRITAVVQYNFHPDVLAFCLWCHYVYGSRLLLEVEDISKISLKDWLPGSEIRAFNQFFTFFLQEISLKCCDALFAPSSKFLDSFPRCKKVLIVRGCQQVCTDSTSCGVETDKIHVLLSGSLTLQNGLGIFFDALKQIDSALFNAKFHFSVCGVGRFDYVRQRLNELKNVHVDFKGTLTNADFAALYKTVHVCLVLQDPNGRFGVSKSPSKGYEALCSGKTIVVTDIGDFGQLPDSICYHLQSFNASDLARVFANMSRGDVERKNKAALQFAKINYDLPVVGRQLIEL